jgi:hypothetical protein
MMWINVVSRIVPPISKYKIFHWRIVLSCILMIVSIGSIMLYLLGVCPLVEV